MPDLNGGARRRITRLNTLKALTEDHVQRWKSMDSEDKKLTDLLLRTLDKLLRKERAA